MAFTVPDFFEDNDTFPSLYSDTLRLIVYSQHEEQRRVPITLSKNLLVYLVSGKKIINEAHNSHTVTTGEAALLRRGAYLMSEIEPPYEAMLFFYDDALLGELAHKYPAALENARSPEPSAVITFGTDGVMQEAIRAMHTLVHEKTDRSDLLRLKFEELFLHLLHAPEKARFAAFLNDVRYNDARWLKKRLESHREAIGSVEEMMQLSGMPPAAFRRTFKTQFGCTPKQWLDGRRLEQAATLLNHGEMNVAQVCFEAGFNNLSWFSRRFKERFGVSPSSYKAQKNNTIA